MQYNTYILLYTIILNSSRKKKVKADFILLKLIYENGVGYFLYFVTKHKNESFTAQCVCSTYVLNCICIWNVYVSAGVKSIPRCTRVCNILQQRHSLDVNICYMHTAVCRGHTKEQVHLVQRKMANRWNSLAPSFSETKPIADMCDMVVALLAWTLHI